MDRSISKASLVVVACILLLSLGLNFAGIDYGQPKHYDYSVDSIHPALSLDAIDHLGGERSVAGLKYPRLHFLVVGAAQYAYLKIWRGEEGKTRGRELMAHFRADNALVKTALRESYRPFLDPLGELIVVARGVSALMGTLLVLAMFLLGRELYGTVAGIVTSAFVAVSYPVVYYSHTANVDIPYLMWGAFGLVCAVRAIRVGKGGWLLLAAILAACAVATKDQAYGWFLLSSPVVLLGMWRPLELAERGEEGLDRVPPSLVSSESSEPPATAALPRRFPWRAMIVAGVASVAVLLVANGLPFDVDGVRGHFEHIFGDGVQPYREFDSTFVGEWMLMGETLLHIVDSLGRPLSIVAFGSGILLLTSYPLASLVGWSAAAGYYATFIALIGYVYLRFTLPIQLILLLFVGGGIARLAAVRRVRWIALLATLVLIGDRALLAVDVDRLLVRDPRSASYGWFQQHLDRDDVVAVVVELPMHNLDFPHPDQARFIDPTASTFGFGDSPPDYLVQSLFDPPRKLLPSKPPLMPSSVRQFNRQYELVETFAPDSEHPLRGGASFQPTIYVFRRVEEGE